MKNLFTLLLVSLTLLSNAQNRCGTEAHTLELIEKISGTMLKLKLK